MSRTAPPLPLTCDVEGCEEPPVYVCKCRRCRTESPETERFHACGEHENHRAFVEAKHKRIRGTQVKVEWAPHPPPRKHMPAAELFERARATLAGKSRSYVEDARLFAKTVLLIELAVKEGAIQIEVEED